VRVLAQHFRRSENMERIWRRNCDLVAQDFRAEPSAEQFKLFRAYLDARHADGGMADMSVMDYAMMVGDSHVKTVVTEYRIAPARDEERGRLLAVSLTDTMSDGISMVYSFFDPHEKRRSLGTYLILDTIERMRKAGLPHVYLGYWVEGSRKMAYKVRYFPQEHLGMAGWELHDMKPQGRGAAQQA
jgi:arginine-tRNA-protein transferase